MTGERLAQQRLHEAEADVDFKHREKVALHEISQEFESQRLQPQQANQWADQAQKRQNKLAWRIGNENRLFPEHQAKKDCHEIEELRRTCCEEADPAETIKN